MPLPDGNAGGSFGPLRWWRALLAVLVIVVCVLAVVPTPPRQLSTGWDKMNHLLAFACLAVTARFGYPGRRAPVAIVLGLLAFGGLIEIVQAFVPERRSEWIDVMADAIGIAAGMVIAEAARWVRNLLRA